jgi:hypothetical protein
VEIAIRQGRAQNRLYRKGAVAAHLIASPGRLLVAFPAGNCGAAVWLTPAHDIEIEGPLISIERDGMRGIAARIVTPTFEIERALLGSLRGVRGHAPAEQLAPEIERSNTSTVLRRTMRDGHRIELVLTHDRFEACVDTPPLTPIPVEALLDRDGSEDLRDALAFLAYEEKLLAGSWRFLTYFGRDTLLTLALLMDVASERLIEAGLGAVLTRLGPDGDVAHEEAIGEWPALSGGAPLDYHMVDDDFMLAPVVASYFARAPHRREPFLARYGAPLRKNLELCLARATPYASDPKPENLIAIRSAVGQWRDSPMGLGGGRYPYDVNAILVPAALRAAAELGCDAQPLLTTWTTAANHFAVTVEDPQSHLDSFCAERGLARTSIDAPVTFPALALDDRGAPLPILHSDESFALLFDQPPPEPLVSSVQRMLRPFPAGLLTPVGLLVANPAYASPELRALFTERHYHGTVVWSWQQALLAIGLDSQLARTDLLHPTRAHLERARTTLRQTMAATRALATSELWTFAVDDGDITLVPFGQGEGHADESNAVQLWSTVQLAFL